MQAQQGFLRAFYPTSVAHRRRFEMIARKVGGDAVEPRLEMALRCVGARLQDTQQRLLHEILRQRTVATDQSVEEAEEGAVAPSQQGTERLSVAYRGGQEALRRSDRA